MDINYYTVKENLDRTRGYGNAGFNVVRSLQELGHAVPYDDPNPKVSLNFAMPTQYKFHSGQYRIGYTPWESTRLPPNWRTIMNSCDEVWAPTKWVTEVYKNCGIKPPMHVYPHGLDPSFKPVRRSVTDVVKFLHIGEPALRKGAQMAVDAFRDAFKDREDVHLTVKAMGTSYVAGWFDGKLANLKGQYNNVTVITEPMLSHELLALYHDHHIMVYPSYGEGFGLIPLQALGTGMPTICTDDWAPYRHFLQDLKLYGRYAHSPWVHHPGSVYHPDYDMLVQLYRHAAANAEDLIDDFYAQAPDVHAEFNWLDLTEKAFKHLTDN